MSDAPPSPATTGALITGASSGIGRSVARALAARGWNLLLGYGRGRDRCADLARALAAEHGVIARSVHLDLAAPDVAVAAADTALRTAPFPVSALVNNAGVNDRVPAEALETSSTTAVFTIDAVTPILLASHFARFLLEERRGGSVVNVTSVHESIPITGGTVYCAAKAALGMSTKVMALELAGRGIRVNSVAPGETSTPMNGVPDDADGRTFARPAIPVGRTGAPAEIADVVAFLLDPASAYVTGTSLTVDGGLTLTAAEENARARPDRLPTPMRQEHA